VICFNPECELISQDDVTDAVRRLFREHKDREVA
jgi:hypothetical protein